MKIKVLSSSDCELSKSGILENLKYLDSKLRENEMFGELLVFGGAVMCLGLNARQSTKDIDAIFYPKSDMRTLISEVAEENNLAEDWINDGVKGFASENGEYTRFGEDIFTNLTINMAIPEYMLAMKCLSCRIGYQDSKDTQDIKFLIDYLGIESAEEAEEIICRYYPESMFPVRTHYVLVNIFGEIK